jgi:Fe2+ transport system protein FeoA
MENLSQVEEGCKAKIIFIQGGKSAAHRLAEMGLLPGEKITMFHNAGAGSVTIFVKGAKLSIGHGLAEKIKVKEE